MTCMKAYKLTVCAEVDYLHSHKKLFDGLWKRKSALRCKAATTWHYLGLFLYSLWSTGIKRNSTWDGIGNERHCQNCHLHQRQCSQSQQPSFWDSVCASHISSFSFCCQMAVKRQGGQPHVHAEIKTPLIFLMNLSSLANVFPEKKLLLIVISCWCFFILNKKNLEVRWAI